MNNATIRDGKQRLADRFIRSKVILLHPSERLPGIRKLMAESLFGRAVLENALYGNVRQGLLRCEPRRGFIRTEIPYRNQESETAQRVDIIACSEVNYMATEFHKELSVKLFESGLRYGFPMQVFRVKRDELITSYPDLIRKNSIGKCFLVAPLHEDIVKLAQAAGADPVVLLPGYEPERGPAVLDSPEMLDIQLNCLYQHGHRKIGYLHEVQPHFQRLPQSLRRERFYQWMCEKGLRIEPHWCLSGECGEAPLEANLNRMFLGNAPPTALICGRDALPRVYAFCRRHHMVIGRDVSIITDGESFSLNPRPYAVYNSLSRIADLAWRLMLARLSGKKDCHILLSSLSLLKGESIANLAVTRS